ncbi:MAG TPA: M20/M25/M40 family metallo-hydrolase [Solirubrobacteraceae bacterium]|nr:M20/M25/M40 family metallo-hydrolase [Solirubrobacteraceae bacterium]
MAGDELQNEAVGLLGELIRFDTVNPPGNERPAIEYLDRYLRAAGFETRLLAADDNRPNLVATLTGDDDGPVLGLLGHVDTVLADPADWEHDPWSGDVVDGFLWGRGALDMKDQVAAEAVAGVALARSGWRPGRGALKLLFVSDEETGGEVGAAWLCSEHPDAARCDWLLNEGAGEVFEFDGKRHFGVACAEKGIFRFNLNAAGEAGHASVPQLGDNALLKLAPALTALADAPRSYTVTEAPGALLDGLGLDSGDVGRSLDAIGSESRALRVLIEPMFEITLTPTMVSASSKMNVIPARAQLRVDCRTPPGLGEDAARRRIAEVLGDDAGGLQVEFFEQTIGNASPIRSQLMDAITRWIDRAEPGASTVPLILPAFSDSTWFRDAFPDCVAYGFFPMRHQTFLETYPLMHNANERIDVRDLGFATRCYYDLIVDLLG